ncbi:hypothetical protein SAMN05446037_10379 [Anaerovirgula multivorans]|uniref:Uncharacterized protein n=1 Tax=Anaerovirgula multivorans TaxID=312168 RepID=A0A239JNU0_9FIRM|nr:hypothetical protein [Anaerovirgula multivorans]SNT07003.1 hypothetical protein SAMN05446037_10379 [Anaerovirgula multivorans]
MSILTISMQILNTILGVLGIYLLFIVLPAKIKKKSLQLDRIENILSKKK